MEINMSARSPYPYWISYLPRLENAVQLAEERKITLEIAIPEPAPSVFGDSEKLMAVVNQLLDNALKFTPPNGKITVRAISQKADVVISVSDTGIGIPNDRLNEVFEPFHQLDESAAAGMEVPVLAWQLLNGSLMNITRSSS